MARTRKIAMAKRETAEKRSVTLTKRRQGLFNKAAAICWICNAQVAILVTSICSKEKVYSFGYPSVDSVFDWFLNNSSSVPAEDDDIARSACSLWKDRKALENQLGDLLLNKKGSIVSEGELLADFDEFEKSNSIEDLQAVKDSLQSLLNKARSKLNNSNHPSTSALDINNVNPISDDLLALEGLRHCDDSPPSSLDDVTSPDLNSTSSFAYINCNNNVSENSSNGFEFDGVPLSIAEPNFSSNSNTDSDFPSGHADADYLWSLISVSSDFSNISSDAFPIANNAADDNYGTPWTTPYELASGSGATMFRAAEFSDFGAVNHDRNCNAKEDFSTSDYGFMDLVGEYGSCMIDHQRLPLLMPEANPFEDLMGH